MRLRYCASFAEISSSCVAYNRHAIIGSRSFLAASKPANVEAFVNCMDHHATRIDPCIAEILDRGISRAVVTPAGKGTGTAYRCASLREYLAVLR